MCFFNQALQQSWALISSLELLWALIIICGHSAAVKSKLLWCHECSWVLMSAHECSLCYGTVLKSAYDCSWLPMSTQEGSWPCINAHECSWHYAHECWWLLMSIHEHSEALMCTNERSWALLSAHRQSWAKWALLSLVPWHSKHSWVLMTSREHS